jgi:hypothetical protein
VTQPQTPEGIAVLHFGITICFHVITFSRLLVITERPYTQVQKGADP